MTPLTTQEPLTTEEEALLAVLLRREFDRANFMLTDKSKSLIDIANKLGLEVAALEMLKDLDV